MIMNYNLFREIFNKTIFEKSKADLLEKISKYPNRYIGLFRPTKPQAKILQNLLQSHEIRFGDAFERLIEEYLKIQGCKLLPKKITNNNGETLNIDQCFYFKNKVYFIEQKVRDDHDSTKKRGQIQNFEQKLNVMLSNYKENEIIGIFYFIDPELTKNKNFYIKEIKKISDDYNVELYIFYGKDLFTYLKYEDLWEEILEHLTNWKKEIPEFPEINFDLEPQKTFEEIKNLKPSVFRNLLTNDKIFKEIILTLFPQKTTLKLLYDFFLEQNATIYQNLAKKLYEKL